MTSPAARGTSLPTEARPRERTPLLPLFGWAGFAMLVLYTVLLGGGWIGVYSAGIRVVSLAIVCLGLATWLLVAWRRPEWRPITSIWPALVLPLAAITLSTITSPFPRLGLEYVTWSILLTALYLLLVRVLALPYARLRIGGLAALLALILGVAYVARALVLWAEWWSLVGELRVPPLRPMYLSMPWGGPGAVMTVQLLLVAVAAAGLGNSTRAARVTLAALVILSALVSLISGSRSGWLAVVAALAILAVLWFTGATDRAALTRALRGRRAQVLLAIGGLVTLAVAVVAGPAMVDRFLEGGDGGRPVYWATALRMFADSPLLGQGPGNWAARRIVYTEPGELDFYIPHAHNQVLETGAEYGLVGLAAGAVALGAVAWLAVRAMKGADPVRRRWAWATTFVVFYLAIATVVDSYTYPAFLLPMAIPIAYLDATSDRRLGLPARLRGAAGPLRRLAIAALILCCAAAIVVLARAESVALTHTRAVEAANEADWQHAIGPAMEAVEADPQLAPYQVTAGLAAAGSGDWVTAEAAFRAASAIDDLPAAWLGLALAQAELGRPPDEVAASLARAMRVGRQHPALALAVGQVYDRLGMTEAADDAYVATLKQIPSLAADARWAADLGATRFAALIDGAIEAEPDAGWEIALMVGDPGRARSLAAGRTDGWLVSTIIDAWSGDPIALAAIERAADRDPLDARVLAWTARLTERAGDRDAAGRYRRLVDIGMRGADLGVEVRVGERVPLRDAGLGTGTYYYGNYMYRRTTPIDLMVPGIPGLSVDEHP